MISLCKILIAEDELIIRQGIRHLVDWKAYGFEIVAETRNGREALEKMEKLRPHIVITDIVMPIMNGIELIQSINSLYPGTQVIALSGYSDFEYVKSSFRLGAVDYILKPTLNPTELLSAVRAASKRISGFSESGDRGASDLESKLGQLLSGYYTEDTLSLVTSHFNKVCFTLCGMDLHYILGQDVDLELQLRLVEGISQEYLREFKHFVFIHNNDILLIVVNHREGENPEIMLSAMAAQVAEENNSVFFVCSEKFYGAENLSEKYNNAFEGYLRKQFYHRDINFLCLRDYSNPDGRNSFKFSDLSKLLAMKNVGQAINYLRENVINILYSQSMEEAALKTLAKNAVYHIVTTMDEMGEDLAVPEELKRDCLMRIGKPRFADEFAAEFSAAMDELNSLIKVHKNETNESMMSKILAYINTHYYSSLTLAGLAKQFNFNYNYLSAYFGSNNPEGFSKYLNRIRIEKALELLRDPDMTVSEICFRVGYTDHSYFTRVFKKYTGITPSLYRSTYSEESSEAGGEVRK